MIVVNRKQMAGDTKAGRVLLIVSETWKKTVVFPTHTFF